MSQRLIEKLAFVFVFCNDRIFISLSLENLVDKSPWCWEMLSSRHSRCLSFINIDIFSNDRKGPLFKRDRFSENKDIYQVIKKKWSEMTWSIFSANCFAATFLHLTNFKNWRPFSVLKIFVSHSFILISNNSLLPTAFLSLGCPLSSAL